MKTFRLKMEMTYTDTTITVFRGRDPRPVLFTGDAYWQWGLGRKHTPPEKMPERAWGAAYCWAEALHDALEGWHACVLHTGDELAVLPKHPDYARVEALWHKAQEAA